MYKVTDHNTREVHCEVFERQFYEPGNREMYPPEEAFTGKLVKSKNGAAAMLIWIEMSR